MEQAGGTMLTHEEMIGLQAEKHDLILETEIRTKEQYVLHLMHTAAYMHVAPLATGRKVLDLGCNTGYGAAMLADVAQHVTGVDVSASAIGTAKQCYDRKNLEFLETNGQSLPFDSDSYDIIVSCQVIEHIVDYEAFLGEIKRVLKPDGIVIFTTPNALIRLDPGMKPWNEFHVREFSAGELERFLGRHFARVKVYGLEAEEPLARIERERVGYARQQARASSLKPSRPSVLRRVARKITPQFIIDYVATRGVNPAQQAQELAGVRSRYRAEDFTYGTEALDNCLDLLAVCGSADSRPGDIRRKS